MPNIREEPSPVSPLVITGLILAAFEHLERLGLSHPTATSVLEATGAGRAQAYEYRRRVLDLVPQIAHPVGRPEKPALPLTTDAAAAITRELLAFLMTHPGAVSGRETRNRYSDSLRAFVLELRERHIDLELGVFARATNIPLGTLEDWITRASKPKRQTNDPAAPPDRAATSETSKPTTENPPAGPASKSAAIIPEIETIVSEWDRWDGDFGSFCAHVQATLRIQHGRTWIGAVLEAHGRRPSRRGPRTIDKEAIRGAFQTFFPGAQWVGDGMQVTLRINDQPFSFNLELIVDANSGAFVGISVRPTEDAEAVVNAFSDGKQTTGAGPLAILLDNRPSNHEASVDAALGDTIRIRATPFRPENKAPVEGAFGLFSQIAPPLEITASSPEEIARGFIEIIVTIWARAMNHVPRADRAGRSRVDLYREANPTPEQISTARQALRERMRKMEEARQRQLARQNPEARRVLDEAFDELGLIDPDNNIRLSMAAFSLDAIIAGIAIFRGKKKTGSLHPDQGARYLFGIVKNVSQDNDAAAIAEALLRARIDARDRALTNLEVQLDELLRSADPYSQILDRLTQAERFIDRIFWREALAAVIESKPRADHASLLQRASRRIQATYRIPNRDRQTIVRRLMEHIVPVA